MLEDTSPGFVIKFFNNTKNPSLSFTIVNQKQHVIEGMLGSGDNNGEFVKINENSVLTAIKNTANEVIWSSEILWDEKNKSFKTITKKLDSHYTIGTHFSHIGVLVYDIQNR